MLKITLLKPFGQAEGTPQLILEGRLDGPWVGELARIWEAIGANSDGSAPVEVDLSGVNYTSEAGAALLRAMRVRGADLTADSPLSKSWIEDQIGSETERFIR